MYFCKISVSIELEDYTALLGATSAQDCLMILKDEKIFTPSDVIFLQFLLRDMYFETLFLQCCVYAETQGAMYFYETPTPGIFFILCRSFSNYLLIISMHSYFSLCLALLSWILQAQKLTTQFCVKVHNFKKWNI